ncbi:MAG: RNA pyrophosphohydrolase [Magnetovibrio sp.]|nr:RNA pyrophosphohydrolase [Magnetovibrio sp.]|tara:strand:+ start:772 stop:1266 length:495 start_codon:yes stop_codon:yes gene_type:complete
MVEAQGYRKGVGAVIFNRSGLVWLGRRISNGHNKYTHTWQMPQGGIDESETPETAVLREVKEETGTDKVKIIDKTPDWIDYDLPEHLRSVTWHGEFRGQRQLWFALKFTGRDTDFDLKAHKNPEFSAWRWAELLSLPELVVPFKRKLYLKIITEFHHWPKRMRT